MFVVVPAYNEEKNIGRVVRGLFERGHQNVVVVDDGSSDHTVLEAKTAGALVLLHEINRGQGAALQTGDEYVLTRGADVVVHFDADGQFNPSDIDGAVALLRAENFDIVLGSRFLDGRSQIPWFKAKIIFPISRWINFVFTGVKLTDVHNGFRVLNRSALEKINITHNGMAHNSEIVAQIKKFNLKFKEYPVQVTYSEMGQGIKGGFKIIWDLLSGSYLN